jgi:nucleoside-diphosphate-sugar epimerase
MQKKVLLTGSSGFLGSHILTYLFKNKIKVFDVLKKKRKNNKLNKKLANKYENYQPIFYNSYSDLEKKLKKIKIDIVIHCATFYSLGEDYKTILKLINSNLIFSLLITKNSIYNCKKFINFGSMMEFAPSKLPPKNIYAVTKICFENFLKFYSNKNVDAKIYNIKLFETYGDNDKRKKIIPTIIKNYSKNKEFLLFSKQLSMNFIHVNQVINFIEKIIFKNAKPGSYCLRNNKFIKIDKMLKNLNLILRRKIKIKYLNKTSNQQINNNFNLNIILSKNNIEGYLYNNLKKFDTIN